VAGAGVSASVGSGALVASASDVSGVGTVGAITGTGVLQAQASQISGEGLVLAVITGSGSLFAGAATLDGIGSIGAVVIGDSHDGVGPAELRPWVRRAPRPKIGEPELQDLAKAFIPPGPDLQALINKQMQQRMAQQKARQDALDEEEAVEALLLM